MTSNYLNIKYPNEGYNKPLSSPNVKNYHHLSVGFKNRTLQDIQDDKDYQDKYDSIKKVTSINVCECGEEWEHLFSKHQEGCYPYISSICQSCKLKNDAEDKMREAERKEEERLLKQQELVNRFDEQIPPRYRGKLTKPINSELLSSICSIIWGGFGSGKTWESYSIAKELVTCGEIKTFKLTTEIDLLNDLKSDFTNIQWKIDNYKNLDLLIVDESGKNNDSNFNKAQLFGILNHRYDWEKRTILICNAKDKQEIRDLLPTATLDRFRECVVEMNGKSKRYQ